MEGCLTPWATVNVQRGHDSGGAHSEMFEAAAAAATTAACERLCCSSGIGSQSSFLEQVSSVFPHCEVWVAAKVVPSKQAVGASMFAFASVSAHCRQRRWLTWFQSARQAARLLGSNASSESALSGRLGSLEHTHSISFRMVGGGEGSGVGAEVPSWLDCLLAEDDSAASLALDQPDQPGTHSLAHSAF